MAEDPYLDPAARVLRNRLGITETDALARAEADVVTARVYRLLRRRLEGGYDLDHFRAFHRCLFGDLYDWAGDLRTVNIARSVSFGHWRHIERYLDLVFLELADEGHLQELDRHDFIRRLAHYLAEVNAAHPFREGNGRTQRAFFGQLATDAGWIVRWSAITPVENDRAAEASMSGDLGPLVKVLERVVTSQPNHPDPRVP